MSNPEAPIVDWRLPENRREAFQRSYTFSLEHRSFPGMVYSMLPEIAKHFDLTEPDELAWLAWLNGNTQNVVTTYLLLEAAPSRDDWEKAVDFWNVHFKTLEWDTDRRHQKSKFGEATTRWVKEFPEPGLGWLDAGLGGWRETWAYTKSQPYMGRLSAWSMLEYARILLGPDIVPDMGSWLLDDVSGSRSHRNGLAVVAGYDAWSWEAEAPKLLGIVDELEELADDLLDEARTRNFGHHRKDPKTTASHIHPLVSRLTMESALCTYKSWHKPNRRYPNVYADMMYERIRKAEQRWSRSLHVLWTIRAQTLPGYLRLEDSPYDPGLCAAKQNHYRETGEIPLLSTMFEDMPMSGFDRDVANGAFGQRKDKSWT